MKYYLGVDIGTTSTKAVAFDEASGMLAKHSVVYDMQHSQPNYSEQEPVEIFKAVVTCINKVVGEMENTAPVFISFSAAMHSLMAVDENGNALTKLITWADNRAADNAENIKNSADGKRFYNKTGVPVHAMSPFSKLLWMKENEPSVFDKAYKFIGIKEYIFYKLFREYVVDAGIASATGLLNIESLQWDEMVLNYVGITAERLARVVSVKEIFYLKNTKQEYDGEVLNISPGTPFVIGGSDGAMANVAEAAKSTNAMVITVGTSIAVRITTKKIMLDGHMRTFCYHAKDDAYIIGGAGNNGGIVLQWLKENIFNDNENYDVFFALAKDVAAGSDGLIFLPYILGERAPYWDAKAKGIFFGLTVGHNKAHIIRAAMEGVVYALYSIGKILMEKNEIAEIYTGGGFAQNELWLQMLADMFNKEILINNTVESSALGAVITGMETLELKAFEVKKPFAVFKPVAADHETYIKSFEKFERLYFLLKEEF